MGPWYWKYLGISGRTVIVGRGGRCPRNSTNRRRERGGNMTSETRDAKQSSESPALQDLIEMVPGLVLCALPDAFAEFANRAWQEYVGCSLQQLTGWGWQTALHPDDVTNFIEDWNASLTAETPFKTE